MMGEWLRRNETYKRDIWIFIFICLFCMFHIHMSLLYVSFRLILNQRWLRWNGHADSYFCYVFIYLFRKSLSIFTHLFSYSYVSFVRLVSSYSESALITMNGVCGFIFLSRIHASLLYVSFHIHMSLFIFICLFSYFYHVFIHLFYTSLFIFIFFFSYISFCIILNQRWLHWLRDWGVISNWQLYISFHIHMSLFRFNCLFCMSPFVLFVISADYDE